jgi:outer membrane protein assembly factor BamB
MKRNNSVSHFIAIFALIVVVMMIIMVMVMGGLYIRHALNRQTSTCVPTIINHQSSISALWTQQDIYISPNESTRLVAVEGKIIFIGSITPDNSVRLIAFDENTGNLIWQLGNNNAITLAASSSMLFVGEVGNVTAINPNNGEIVWSSGLPFTNGVTKLLIRNNILYVDTASRNHFLLDTETGKVLQAISYSVDNASNPDVPVWSNHKMDFEFVENISFFQKQIDWPNITEVEIVATDEISGTKLWSSTLSIMGQAAVNPLGIFVLDTNGKLLRLDTKTGAINKLIQFVPFPNKLYECPSGGFRDYGYYLTADNNSQMVFIYLGDGAQLFAYRLPISQ